MNEKNIEIFIQYARLNMSNVQFKELAKLCNYYFGKPRRNGTSHCVYKTPWQGDPRVNIQLGKNGKAKIYQVKQVLLAIEKLREHHHDKP